MSVFRDGVLKVPWVYIVVSRATTGLPVAKASLTSSEICNNLSLPDRESPVIVRRVNLFRRQPRCSIDRVETRVRPCRVIVVMNEGSEILGMVNQRTSSRGQSIFWRTLPEMCGPRGERDERLFDRYEVDKARRGRLVVGGLQWRPSIAKTSSWLLPGSCLPSPPVPSLSVLGTRTNNVIINT